MSNCRNRNETEPEEEENTGTDHRKLPLLPGVQSALVMTALENEDRAVNEKDSLALKLQHTKPVSKPILPLKTTTNPQTDQISKILQHFQKNISSFHDREKYIQVEVIVGLEKRLAEFSEAVQRTLLNNGLPRLLEKKRIEWPVCGKYPHCAICNIEIQDIVSLLVR